MKKGLIIVVIIFIIILCLSLMLMHNKEKDNIKDENKVSDSLKSENKIIFSTTYYFAFGSRKVKIYENGDVYDDLEIEDPNHKENYKFVKKLSKEQLNNLKAKLKNTSDNNELDDFVIELVYEVKEFDNNR